MKLNRFLVVLFISFLLIDIVLVFLYFQAKKKQEEQPVLQTSSPQKIDQKTVADLGLPLEKEVVSDKQYERWWATTARARARWRGCWPISCVPGRVGWNGIRPCGAFLRGGAWGFCIQNPLSQLVCDQVGEEVVYGPKNYGANTDLASLLGAADLVELRESRTQNLSVGQQQRTALAATLALHPRLLILDEPTLGQDWAHLSKLMDYLVHLNDNGQAILLITHDDRLVCRYARRIVRMVAGRIVADGAVPATAPVVSPPDVVPARQ